MMTRIILRSGNFVFNLTLVHCDPATRGGGLADYVILAADIQHTTAPEAKNNEYVARGIPGSSPQLLFGLA